MRLPYRIRRLLPPLLAFGLVAGGTMTLLPDENSVVEAEVNVAVLVLNAPAAAGTPTDELSDLLETRLVPPDAVAFGALTNPSDLPDGVLAVDHVAGQQLLGASFVETRLDAVGAGLAAVSVRLDSQRWAGPVDLAGGVVDVYETSEDGARLLVSGARVLIHPEDSAELDPRAESIITIAVAVEQLPVVLSAASAGEIWLVGS